VGPDGRDQMVNYRVKGNIYIVDRLFNKAALLLGTGRHQIYFWIVREKPVNGSPAKG
jgi:type IV secretion system protein VirB9